MIRHAKWHRKREESMQYGFMRYSPCDDCTVISCPHNGRQTHYHCMQSNCDKVRIIIIITGFLCKKVILLIVLIIFFGGGARS